MTFSPGEKVTKESFGGIETRYCRSIPTDLAAISSDERKKSLTDREDIGSEEQIGRLIA